MLLNNTSRGSGVRVFTCMAAVRTCWQYMQLLLDSTGTLIAGGFRAKVLGGRVFRFWVIYFYFIFYVKPSLTQVYSVILLPLSISYILSAACSQARGDSMATPQGKAALWRYKPKRGLAL
jgi:hypothetical protein